MAFVHLTRGDKIKQDCPSLIILFNLYLGLTFSFEEEQNYGSMRLLPLSLQLEAERKCNNKRKGKNRNSLLLMESLKAGVAFI